MTVRSADGISCDAHAPIAIVGAGACGLVAALTAADAGVEVIVLERDPLPSGSTALSSGMIPACGTELQNQAGIADSAEIMAQDILAKARSRTDPDLVDLVCRESGPAVDWLVKCHGLPLTLVEGFLYPGHNRLRMHAPVSRTGADLIGGLTRAAETSGITILTDACVTGLYAEADGRINGLVYERPDRSEGRIGCDQLILACNGFGGNPDLVRLHIPDMADAGYFGHVGNQGDALTWGGTLGAQTADLGSFQGHGSVAHPHGILITWALMMDGGIQINTHGERFSSEHDGYSEQGRRVAAQPDGLAWVVFDDRLAELGRGFEDFRLAERAGAVRHASDVSELARVCDVPIQKLAETFRSIERLANGEGQDRFGRDFTSTRPMVPPYHAIRVAGYLFHTQGGLVVDNNARVMREDGTRLPNLYAGGGAARGVSGPSDWGYLSGNGLLTAVTLGRIAGRSAARRVNQVTQD